MSETTDFYLSWQGCSAFGANGVRLRDQEPLIFSPLDLSGCALWLDANDNGTIAFNDLLQVVSWSNQGYVGGQFDVSGAELIGYDQKQNNLQVLSFPEQGFMQGQFAFNFQDRSFFIVTREKVVPTGTPMPFFTSDTSNAMEFFSLKNGSNIYFVGKHPSPIPELAIETTDSFVGSAVLVNFINGSDMSNNFFGINGTRFPFIFEAAASGYNTSNVSYFLGDYYGGFPTFSSQDMCEVIMYDRVLEPTERSQVEAYLIRKWAITPPPPPPPPAFSPKDISGLQIWLDANDTNAVRLGLSNDVMGWSNSGGTGANFIPGCNVATYGQDPNGNYIIGMPGTTTLDSYFQLTYNSRTQFAVFSCVDDLTALTYPYLNVFVGDATGGVQSGVSYDSKTSNYVMSMCQNGINCPVLGTISNVPIGDYNLCIWAVDSNDYVSTVAYFNGGSNINTSTDLGNAFNTNPIPYIIGSPVSDSPDFRIAEIIEYDTRLDSGQISTVASYLVNKWAISSFTTLI